MKKVGLVRLVAIGFCALCAGPFGLEELMPFGASWAIGGLILAALFWGIPTGLMAAELATNIPETGGPVAWVLYAFGRRTAGFFGYITTCAGMFDLALYPIMFGVAARATFPEFEGYEWYLGVSMIVFSVILNLLGIVRTGDGSIAFSAIIMAPFVLVVSGIEWGQTVPTESVAREAGSLWAVLTIAIWSFAGFESFGAIAAEVEDPQKNIPKAIVWTALSMLFIGSIPIILWARNFNGAWESGASWIICARALNGEVLAKAVGISGIVSAWALFNAQLLTNTRIPARLAIANLLPQWFAPKENSVPVVATIFLGVTSITLSRFGFVENLSMGVALLGIGLVLEFGALWCRDLTKRKKGGYEIPRGIIYLVPFPPLILLCGVLWGILGESIEIGGWQINQLLIAGIITIICLFLTCLFGGKKETT